MWKLSLVSRNTGIDSKKGREAVRVQDVPTHLYTDFCHASLHGLGLLWRGLWAVRTQKSWPVTTKDFIHLQIAQKKEKKQTQPTAFPPAFGKGENIKAIFFPAVLSYHVVLFFGKEMQLGRHMEVLVLLVAMGMSVVSSDMQLWVPSFGLVPSTPPLPDACQGV